MLNFSISRITVTYHQRSLQCTDIDILVGCQVIIARYPTQSHPFSQNTMEHQIINLFLKAIWVIIEIKGSKFGSDHACLIKVVEIIAVFCCLHYFEWLPSYWLRHRPPCYFGSGTPG
jgi:hypothetical protein